MKLTDFRFKPVHNREQVFVFWPITFGWFWSRALGTGAGAIFAAHGWQIGFLLPGVALYGWTLHIGPFKIFFGDRKPVRIEGQEAPYDRE